MNQSPATQTEAPATTPETRSYRRPAYAVHEHKEAFDVHVAMPGVSREGVDIALEDDTLTITGKRGFQRPTTWRTLRSEIPAEDFRLVLTLNVPIEADKIGAKVEDGILVLTLPKAEEIKPRKIKVN
jgi:HSP20 family protein